MSDANLPGALSPAVAYYDSIAINQFSRTRAPVFRRFMDSMLSVRKIGADDPLDQISNQFSLLTAEGIGLDWIGDRLGLPRPGVRIPGEYFGFDQAGRGFDQAPFYDPDINTGEESPVGDSTYRRLLQARAIQVHSNGSIRDMKAIADAIFGQSIWVNIGGGQVGFEACTSEYQLFQLAQSARLLDPADGVELCTIHGPWALITGRREVLRVFVSVAGAATLYDAGNSGDINALDQVLNEVAGNDLQSISWASDTLTITAQGSNNDLANWLSTRSLEAYVLDQSNTFETSVAIAASISDQALEIGFPSSSVFPPSAGDQILIVIADIGTVQETGYHLYVP